MAHRHYKDIIFTVEFKGSLPRRTASIRKKNQKHRRFSRMWLLCDVMCITRSIYIRITAHRWWAWAAIHSSCPLRRGKTGWAKSLGVRENLAEYFKPQKQNPGAHRALTPFVGLKLWMLWSRLGEPLFGALVLLSNLGVMANTKVSFGLFAIRQLKYF